MGLTSDDIDQLIADVWAPTLDLDLFHVDEETGDREVTSVLAATGGWTGHVVVRATSSFARAVAARMFGLPRTEVGAEDLGDAVGELTNVLSGNVKSLLGEDAVDIGLPAVGADVDGGSVIARTILCGGHEFEVTVEVVEGATVVQPQPA